MPRGVYDRTKNNPDEVDPPENSDGTPPADPPQDPPAVDEPEVDGELCGPCFPHGWSIPDAGGVHDTAQCQHGNWVR
jgi:hypothetical protein